MRIQALFLAVFLASAVGCGEEAPKKPATSGGGNQPPAGGFVDKTAGGGEKGKPNVQAGDGGKTSSQ